MRIALVTETFFPAVDGTTTTVKAVSDRLIDLGHELRIIAPGPGLPLYNRSKVIRISPLAKPGAQVRDALADFDPDLVHVTNPGRIGRKALKHAERMDLRTIVVQQSTVDADDRWRTTVAERAGAVVVTCEWMQRELAGHGVTAALWRPGVDSRAFTPALRDPWLHGKWSRGDRPVVGYVGGLARKHDVRELASLAKLNIRTVVIGAGPQRQWLRDRLPDARFTGALATGDLTVAIASLDVLVHPGRRETCCHTLREAAASGVPVVAPRSGGAPEVVHNLESGLLYDADVPHAFAEATANLAADPSRRLLGEQGRELVAARDWVSAVDELIERHYLGQHASH